MNLSENKIRMDLPHHVGCYRENFQGGYSYFNFPITFPIMNGESLQSNDRDHIYLGPLPEHIAAGTIKIETGSKDVKILSIEKVPNVKRTSSLEEPISGPASILNILLKNIGKRVTLVADEFHETGRLKSVNSDVIILQTSSSHAEFDQILNLKSIKNVTSESESDHQVERYICVKYQNIGKEDVKGNLSYLTKGCYWTPFYFLTMEPDQGKVSLEGRANIIADMEFPNQTPIPKMSLIDGLPTIGDQNLFDPLIQTQITQTPGPILRHQNRQSTQMPMNWNTPFHYDIKDVEIKKHMATNVSFFEEMKNVEYNDIFLIRTENANNEGDIEIDHELEFMNKGNVPLAHGIVNVLSKNSNDSCNKFEFQGKIPKTLENEMVRIDLGNSKEIIGKISLVTNDRKVEDEESRRRTGCMVTTQYQTATITIKNNRKKSSICRVEHILTGTLVKSYPSFQDKIGNYKRHLNEPKSEKTKYMWEIIIPAECEKGILIDFFSRKIQKTQTIVSSL